MELLQSGTKQMEALLPECSVQPSVFYRPSIYNCIRRLPGGVYVFNTLSRRLARLSPAEEKLLRTSRLPGQTPEAAPLIAKRFLVAEGTDELTHYRQVHETLELFAAATDKGVTQYIIMPTTGCNARCFYCFEQGVAVENMTEETADQVAAFIQNTRHREAKTELVWYGGEPLLRPQIISRICAALRAADVPFKSTMVTNGSLLTPQLIETAKTDWLLDGVQITLDGVGQTHDQRKAYVGFENAFERTLETIACVLDSGIAVTVRMNMDLDNAADIARLYELLKQRFPGDRRIAFDPSLLAQKLFGWQAGRTPQQQAQLRQSWLQLWQQIRQDGRDRHLPLDKSLPRFHCRAQSPSSVTILPSGILSICQTGCEDMYYGDVRQGITDPERKAKWRQSTEPRPQCRDCVFLPECTGFSLCPSPESDCRAAMESTFESRFLKTVERWEKCK